MNRSHRRQALKRAKRGLVLYGVFDVAQDVVVAVDGFRDVKDAVAWFFSQAAGNALELREVGFDPRDGRDVLWLDSEITVAELWACDDPNCTEQHSSLSPTVSALH
jgi:hypothetical protein